MDLKIATIKGKGLTAYVQPLGMMLDRKLEIPNFSFYKWILQVIRGNRTFKLDPSSLDNMVIQIVVTEEEFGEIDEFCRNELRGYCTIEWFEDYLTGKGISFNELVNYLTGDDSDED